MMNGTAFKSKSRNQFREHVLLPKALTGDNGKAFMEDVLETAVHFKVDPVKLLVFLTINKF